MGKTISFIFSASLLLVVISFLIKGIISSNDHHFIYPLDDAYIHLSMAKNLSQHGIWGVTEYEFSSASSSILFTLFNGILFKIFGASIYVPLAINIVAVLLILTTVWYFLKDERIGAFTLLIILLLLIFFTPLPSLVISGMEHILQILFDLLFVLKAVQILESKTRQRKSVIGLSILAALVVSIRFEGIFLVAVVSGLFLLKKDFSKGVLIGICGLIPVILFGLISVKNGSYFIPNSLLMKGERPKMNLHGLIAYPFVWLEKLKSNPHLFVLFFWMIIHFINQRKKNISIWEKQSIFTVIVVLTTILHLTFAKTGWFFRYEAYLVFLSIFSFTWILHEVFQRFSFQLNKISEFLALLLLVMLTLYPLYSRGKKSLVNTIPATNNIYQQQYQMAQFLKKYYNTSRVCANDIGAICFFTDLRLFDMFGLASKEVISLRIKSLFDKEHIHQLALEKKSEIVIIYDDWFIGKVPDQWKRAGQWEVSNNVILGGNTVTFFTTEFGDAEKLKQNLKDFSPSLPEEVKELSE